MDSYGKVGLESAWFKLADLLGADYKQASLAWLELLVLYSSPDRFYHTLTHIKKFYQNFRFLTPNRLSGSSAFVAIYYHDSVYNPKADYNEERSAEFAVEVLKRFGQIDVRQEIARDLILATKEHKPLQCTLKELSEYFLDADLRVLGSNPGAYEVYSQRIRQEYSWVPDDVYKTKRTEILEGFLKRPSIYFTDPYKHLFEEKAITNLKWELQSLND